MSQTAITEDILIGELVETHPEAIETLLSFGVHCIGCHVSPYESLGEGFRNHGLGEEQIQEALGKLNDVVSQKKVETPPQTEEAEEEIDLSLTVMAAEKIKEFCAKSKKQALRIAVKAGGCSGYEYVFSLDDTPKTQDIVIEQTGLKIYIDPASLHKINGSIIEYQDSLTDAGFKVKNPHAKSSCGCGNSFS